MIDQNLLVIAGVAALSLVIFVVARFLLSRNEIRLERRLAFPRGDAGRVGAGTLASAGAPNLAGRVDQSFEGMVFRTGLGFSAGQTLAVCALTAIALALLLFFWLEEEWAAGVGLAVGLVLPILILWILQGRRQRLLQGQLPDAFFYLARALRAGLSLEQAITQAGAQLDEPLASEFRRCAGQIQLGLHPQFALQNMAGRLRLSDFDIFVSTVGLYYQSGGNLALLLDRLAASTRDRIQFLGYFRAATALGRTAGFVLGAAVPILIIAFAVLQPDLFGELFRSPAGWQLLIIVAVLELIGIVWFVYLLRVDY